MNRRRTSLLLAASWAASLGAVDAAVASIFAAGRVIGVDPEGGVDVVRRDGTRVAARTGLLLRAGDVFVIRGEGQVVANVYGRITTYQADSDPKSVPDSSVGPVAAEQVAWFDEYSTFLSTPPPGRPFYSAHRGPDGPAMNIQPAPNAPVGQQYLLQGTNRLALIWQGGPAVLEVQPNRGPSETWDSRTSAWVVKPLPEGSTRFVVTMPYQSLKWSIDIVAKDAPEAARVRAWPENYAARLEAAVKLLWSEDARDDSWRVFAFTTLHELARPSRDGDNRFLALTFLDAALGGVVPRKNKRNS